MNENVGIANPFDPAERPVTVSPIENGYIVSTYDGQGRYQQWYAVDEHEVHEKLRKFLF